MRHKEYELIRVKDENRRLKAEKAHLEKLAPDCSLCMERKAVERINELFYCGLCLRVQYA